MSDKRVVHLSVDQQNRLMHTLPVWARERIKKAEAERDALRELITSVAQEAQRIWYGADTFSESQRGLKLIKRKLDAAIDAARATAPPPAPTAASTDKQ
jgi:hypothetical protein